MKEIITDRENDLIDSIIKGDYELFGRLIETYQSSLFNFINRMIRNSDDAMDLTQDAFFKAYRSIKSFKFRSKFSTWLFQIAYHEAVNYINKHKRYYNIEKRIEVKPYSNDYLEIENSELFEHIEKMLNNLKKEQRIALHLLYKEEKSYIEIAEIMKMPINTVKSHIRRGKETLKQLLSEKYDPETILA